MKYDNEVRLGLFKLLNFYLTDAKTFRLIVYAPT